MRVTWLALHGGHLLLFSLPRRAAGYRSVSMPTLCTGGIGIPVQFVAVAAVRSVYWDFCAHPTAPLSRQWVFLWTCVVACACAEEWFGWCMCTPRLFKMNSGVS